MMSLCKVGSDARRGLRYASSANSGCIRGRKRGCSLGMAEKTRKNSASIRSVCPLSARPPGKCSTPFCTPASARLPPGVACVRTNTCRHTCNCPSFEGSQKRYGQPVAADFARFVGSRRRRGRLCRGRRRRKRDRRRRRRRHGILEKNRLPGARTGRGGEIGVVDCEGID